MCSPVIAEKYPAVHVTISNVLREQRALGVRIEHFSLMIAPAARQWQIRL